METIPSGAGRRVKKVLLTIATGHMTGITELAINEEGVTSIILSLQVISANRLGSALPARPCADASPAIASPARTEGASPSRTLLNPEPLTINR